MILRKGKDINSEFNLKLKTIVKPLQFGDGDGSGELMDVIYQFKNFPFNFREIPDFEFKF